MRETAGRRAQSRTRKSLGIRNERGITMRDYLRTILLVGSTVAASAFGTDPADFSDIKSKIDSVVQSQLVANRNTGIVVGIYRKGAQVFSNKR